MSDAARGMPLLSGVPPTHDTSARAEMSCRKCNKEFNVLFARSRRCNHCGYCYCQTCADYQALMPRCGADSSGYDCVPVCAFCIEHLTLTAGGKAYLRSQPLSKLRNYVQAYNIPLRSDVLEKDDLIDAILSCRGPTGYLPAENEEYYRLNSIPNGQNTKPRGLFARAGGPLRNTARQTPGASSSANMNDTSSSPTTPSTPTPYRDFPRPDLDPERQNQSQPRPRTQSQARPQTQSARPQSGPQSAHQTPPYTPYTPRRATSTSSYTQVPRSGSSNSTGPQHGPFHMHPPFYASPPRSEPRPRATSSHPTTTPPVTIPRPPSPPVPALSELLLMTEEALSKLSIGSLKGILFENRVNARLVLEKEELVAKVKALVNEEKRERERMSRVREQEEREVEEMQRTLREETGRKEREKREREEEEKRRLEQELHEKRDEEMRTMHDEPEEAAAETIMEDVVQGNEPVQEKEKERERLVVIKPDMQPGKSAETKAAMTAEAQAKAAALERNGLCVICQDEEANIAIVDCGHLALCRGCSELVMGSTRECPLCRTRIVTSQRLLRIFKT